MTSLGGARVALLEARLGAELADLVRRHGGVPHCVPAVREVPIDRAGQASTLIDSLIGGACSVVVFQTGVGASALFKEAERIGRAEALRSALAASTTVCRGPKPASALRRLGVPVALNVKSPYTTAELLESLEPIELRDVGVAVVHYGELNRALTDAIVDRGARVTDLCLYEWLLPEDEGPLRALVEDLIAGRHDVIAFTTQVQARHLMQVAVSMGRADDLVEAINGRLVVASIGPTCTAGLASLGIRADVEPENPKMGPLMLRLAEYLAGRDAGDRDGRSESLPAGSAGILPAPPSGGAHDDSEVAMATRAGNPLGAQVSRPAVATPSGTKEEAGATTGQVRAAGATGQVWRPAPPEDSAGGSAVRPRLDGRTTGPAGMPALPAGNPTMPSDPPVARFERRRFLGFLGLGGALFASPAFLAACGGGAASAPPGNPAAAPTTKSPAAATGGATAPAASGSPGVAGAPAVVKAGSGEKIKLGFIALTDCASVVMAHELGLFKKYGLDVDVVKQASWASTRDNLLSGDIQGAHCLFGMPFSVYTGVGGTAGKELYITLILNNNGQAITLSKDGFAGKVGYADVKQLKAAVDALRATKEPTFAMTFPGGTHDMWLRYWLAAGGVDQKTVKIITVPPAQMVANMKVGNMDGYCVGEPWGGVAVKEGIGYSQITTQDIWTNHPEKALVVNPDFATKRRDDLKLVMRAVLEASAFIDDPKNKPQVAKTVGDAAYVNANADVIDARLQGNYDLGGGLGQREFKADTMLFSNGGLVNAPRRSYGAWFLTQYVRFGYLTELPDVQAVTKRLILSDLYAEVAKEMGIPVPDDDWAPFTVKLDGATFDPADPAAYLKTHGGVA